jgi:hypothetical protein
MQVIAEEIAWLKQYIVPVLTLQQTSYAYQTQVTRKEVFFLCSVCSLFNDAASNSYYIQLSEWMAVQKETVLA